MTDDLNGDAITNQPDELTADEIIDWSRRYTLFHWSAQAEVDPLPVVSAKGSYFYTADGRRYLDFNSQVMSVNLGHGDRRIVEAICRQAERLPFASPSLTHAPRARLGRRLAELMPGDLTKVLFTLSGAEANEAAIRIARLVTRRHKVISRYRSYHGSTWGAITLTGDPRRWPNEPGIPGVVHVLDPWHGPGRETDSAADALSYLEEVIVLEGPETIAALILEPVSGTNGVLIPPDGYLEGVRELCTRFGIMFIADEVMSGFGRTGAWFAVDHWGVVPDLMTMGKALTSSYLPLGAVGVSAAIAERLEHEILFAGQTHNSHPICCAAALAVVNAYEADGLIGRAREMGELMKAEHARLRQNHSVVAETRSIGLFGILELRDPVTDKPVAPFNGSSRPMKVLAAALRERGLFTLLRWHMVMTNPPLTISADELHEGFAIIDEALSATEAATGWAQ